MPRIRTRFSALAFSLFAAGFFKALLSPFAVFLPFGTERTPDALAMAALEGALIFSVPFLVLHFLLRRTEVGPRWAYPAAGAACLVLVAALSTPAHIFEGLVSRGTATPFILLTLGFGAAIGFIYQHRAGYETEGDDPEALEQALRSQRHLPESDREGPAEALVRTETAEYFDGPLQVRTSVPLMLFASLVSMGIWSIVRLLVSLLHIDLDGAQAQVLRRVAEVASNSGIGLFASVMLGTVPFVAVIYAGHMAARGLKRHDAPTYALLGLAMPLVLGLATFSLLALMGVYLALPGLIAMLTYRQLAGLEPVPVKDDVLVTDRRRLVGADHARRRFGRVVKAG